MYKCDTNMITSVQLQYNYIAHYYISLFYLNFTHFLNKELIILIIKFYYMNI